MKSSETGNVTSQSGDPRRPSAQHVVIRVSEKDSS